MIRLGLCCIFRELPISFRQTTAAALIRLSRDEQLDKLSGIISDNLENLELALRWVSSHNIKAFRVLSPLFPRYTHPDVGYRLDELPDSQLLKEQCDRVKHYAQHNSIRLSLHPDQFNVLSSPDEQVVLNTIRELSYQGYLADLLGIEVINIHAGGVYGDKVSALKRLTRNFTRLPQSVQLRLSLENDDRSYSPEDLLPICRELAIPLVYDVHHHRCLVDSLSLEEATDAAIKSWAQVGREPFFHISSSKEGYDSNKPQPHDDYIRPEDFPLYWLERSRDVDITVDIEAKAKELAIIRLQSDLNLHSSLQEKDVV